MSATIISVISISISGIALVGVLISLVLQARQLRANLLQASRITHSETIRMAFNNPKIVAEALGKGDPDAIARNAYINWMMQHLKMSYSLKQTSALVARNEVASLFEEQFPRDFWASARSMYKVEAFSKREREFVALVDEVYRQATLPQESSGNSVTNENSASPTSP